MRAEQPRMWHHVEKWEENPDPRNWEKVVTIIQAELRGGELAAPCTWKTVVMIPKGRGTDFRGIGLVEYDIWHHQSMANVFHPVPWRSEWILRGERNRDHHPQWKSDSASYCHEGDGPPGHLPRSAKDLRYPGQGLLYWYPSGVWSGSQDTMHHVDVLGPDPDGSKGRGPLRSRLPDPLSVNSGGTPVTHNI